MATEIPEPLKSVFKHRFPVETQGRDWVAFVYDYLPYTPEGGRLFRQQFAHAILHETVTPEQYRALTGDDVFGTKAELYEWFREAWGMLFPNTPISEDDF
jgi:hypothetical protein